MAKFNKRGGNATGPGGEGERKKSGRSAYKAKRSFTRNKSYRGKEKDKDERPTRRERDTPFRDRPFRTTEKSGRGGDDRPNWRQGRSGDDRGQARSSEAGKSSSDGWRERANDLKSNRRTGGAEKEEGRRERPFRKPSGDKPDRRSFGRRDDDRPGRRPERGDKDEKQDPRDRRGKRADEKRVKYSDFNEPANFRTENKPRPAKKESTDGLIRLNKYLSNAGIASRREADDLIKSGAVKVNGVVVDQLGHKIRPGDKVTYGDQSVKGEKKVYLLLNKPKDYITTVEDPRDRKTVMELIAGACRERVYPVGRLDRNTTGLLLFTNDGELTTKLTHPKYNVKKVYHVTLDKSLKTTDFKSLVDGIELEDGPVRADDLAFVGEGKKDIGIEIHSGRNRIVRRMFEHLGYKVVKLDRVVFAGLTKKDLPRGKHRFLTPKEVAFLKMLG